MRNEKPAFVSLSLKPRIWCFENDTIYFYCTVRAGEKNALNLFRMQFKKIKIHSLTSVFATVGAPHFESIILLQSRSNNSLKSEAAIQSRSVMIKSIHHRGADILVFSALTSQRTAESLYTFQTLPRLNSQVVARGEDCISTPPCLFKDTCWAAWLISSSFSRLSGLRGADYQEELIPVALLISLIRAPGRWLEGSCVSHGCSGTTICTGMLAATCYKEEGKTKKNPIIKQIK